MIGIELFIWSQSPGHNPGLNHSKSIEKSYLWNQKSNERSKHLNNEYINTNK